MEGELAHLRASQKVHEERLKLSESERAKLEDKCQELKRELSETARVKEESLSKQVTELKAKLRAAEDEKAKDKSASDKTNALQTQKLAFHEREITALREKLEDANRENRDLLIELKQQEKLTSLHERRANDKEEELKK